MLREIRELGFEYAELSHGIRISLLPGVFEAVDAGEIRISSLHNFCPLPIGVNHAAPNIFKFTSLDTRERENAYRYSVKTIETAARVKAPVVVLHLGCIEMKDYTDKLIALVEAGLRESPKFEKLCAEAISKREARKEKHVQLANEMVLRLADHAQRLGVRLGVENREAVEEIPLEEDFPWFFQELNHPAIGYWHDTGHAQIKENLGFMNHVIHMENLAHRLLGCHIHDVQFPARDHCPPGTGVIDFASLRPFIQSHHLRILEMSPGVEAEEIRQGLLHLKSIWGET
ncbi:MAG TPA: sugar phosphate isomerase/epimerase [Candidatus Paceibacterota bacterium]|nr:sugar phosphate isomerase/epimerase [Candidatus Paceibacterota bacterium]